MRLFDQRLIYTVKMSLVHTIPDLPLYLAVFIAEGATPHITVATVLIGVRVFTFGQDAILDHFIWDDDILLFVDDFNDYLGVNFGWLLFRFLIVEQVVAEFPINAHNNWSFISRTLRGNYLLLLKGLLVYKRGLLGGSLGQILAADVFQFARAVFHGRWAALLFLLLDQSYLVLEWRVLGR